MASCPSGQFRPADLPLLARYCETAVLAEQAAGELAAGGAVVDGKPSPWFAIHQQATRTLAVLALRLHVAPASRAAPKTKPAPLSYYDRAWLEDGNDAEDEAGEAH